MGPDIPFYASLFNGDEGIFFKKILPTKGYTKFGNNY